MHVQQAINTTKQRGLKEAYKKLVDVGTKKECTRKLEEMKLSLEISQGNLDNSTQAKVVKTATEVYEKSIEEVMSMVNPIFLLYSNLLLEKAKHPWTKILAEQVDCSPWMDLQRVEHTAPHNQNKTWDSFMEWITFHLLIVFHHNTAEMQRYYISNLT
jgi:hypothetical protein